MYSGFINTSFLKSAPLELGISRGKTPGHVGVYVRWPESHKQELFRLNVKAIGPGGNAIGPISYTFAPSFTESVLVSLEFPYELREFLTGRQKAETGVLVFEAVLSDGKTFANTFDLKDVLKVYRGKGRVKYLELLTERNAQERDVPEIAKLSATELKAYSDKAREEIAARQRAEEEARKKKEAEKAAADAAKKAAAKGEAGAPAVKSGIQGGRVAIIYGSSTGNTADVAQMIKAELGGVVDHVKNVTELTQADFTPCEIMILGVPTWHIGEMQDDWAIILPDVAKNNYKDKKIAIFGLGDFKGYPDTYMDAMQELWEPFEKTGAKLYGQWPTAGYDFKKSKAIKNGKFLGLAIDIENQNNLTEARVKQWCAQIRSEMGI
jgi:flavodoxin I